MSVRESSIGELSTADIEKINQPYNSLVILGKKPSDQNVSAFN